MTTQGTQDNKPSQVGIKRHHEDGTIDIEVLWDIHEVTETDPDTGEESSFWEYEREVLRNIPLEVPESQEGKWLSVNGIKLLRKAKAKANQLSSVEKNSLILKIGDSPYAQVIEKDASRSDKRYIKVERTIDGTTYSTWCYVTYSLLQAHEAGDLSIGDYVFVDFADDDLDKPVVLDKIVGL